MEDAIDSKLNPLMRSWWSGFHEGIRSIDFRVYAANESDALLSFDRALGIAESEMLKGMRVRREPYYVPTDRDLAIRKFLQSVPNSIC